MSLAFLLFAAATAVAPPAPAPFDPVDFFSGRTRGEGTLKAAFQKPKTIVVDSVGTSQKDGVLLLTQVIREPGKPPRTRYWRMRKDASGGFSGTLSDSAGPVRVDVEPRAIRIRYRDKERLDFDQRLTRAGPRELRNRMTVKRFGITVARFDEIIRKLD